MVPRRAVAVGGNGRRFPAAIERRRWAAVLGFANLADFDHHWRDGWARVTAAHRDGYVPIINKAPAGYPTDYEEYGIDSGCGYEYVPRGEGMDGELLFAVIIIGDSMSPVFLEGDLVIFRPVRQDESVQDGASVFVRFTAARQHGCTFKSVWRRSDGRLDLRAENPSYATLVVSGDEIERMALALGRRPAYWAPLKERAVCEMNMCRSFRRIRDISPAAAANATTLAAGVQRGFSVFPEGLLLLRSKAFDCKRSHP